MTVQVLLAAGDLMATVPFTYRFRWVVGDPKTSAPPVVKKLARMVPSNDPGVSRSTA